MSNPARAPREQLSDVQKSLATAPDAFFFFKDEDAFDKERSGLCDLLNIQRRLKDKDMVVKSPFFVPKELTVDERVKNSVQPKHALAASQRLTPRVRTTDGKGGANVIFGLLPEEGFRPFTKAGVAEAMADKFFVSAGAEFTLGRITQAYPSVRSGHLVVPTPAEVEAALVGSGVALERYNLPSHAFRSYPLIAPEREVGVTINAKSDNGFPVLGKWTTPGAQEKVLQLVADIRRELTAAGSDVVGAVRALEQTNPWLMTLQGKAKSDYYTMDKIENFKLRFYNVVPRQLMLIMQQATQPFEALCRNMAADRNVRTAQGSSLTRQGATALVDQLERQLDDTPASAAYVHAGDDSWLTVRVLTDRGWYVAQCDLDCSNFDLTQHSEVTRPVHDALRRMLRRFDAVSADLWYALMRERQVVVAASVVRTFRHAGPSGMPLQSKVNDLLMEILLARVVGAFKKWHLLARTATSKDRTLGPKAPSVEEVEAALKRIAMEEAVKMGFALKLENYCATPLREEERGDAVRAGLRAQPFKFIGYFFHVPSDPLYPGEVQVFCDLPRTMAQMPYPSLKWMAPKDVRTTEAMRLGSMLCAMGIAPRELEPSMHAFEAYVVGLIETALSKGGNVEDPRLRWAVSESPYAGPAESSLKGLLEAIRNRRALWLVSLELKATSHFVPKDVKFNWVDMDESPDDPSQWRVFQGVIIPPVPRATLFPPKPQPMRKPMVPTHPPTLKNDGRMPPTAVWGPDKPKAPRTTEAEATPATGGGKSRKQRRRAAAAARDKRAGVVDLDELD